MLNIKSRNIAEGRKCEISHTTSLPPEAYFIYATFRLFQVTFIFYFL